MYVLIYIFKGAENYRILIPLWLLMSSKTMGEGTQWIV